MSTTQVERTEAVIAEATQYFGEIMPIRPDRHRGPDVAQRDKCKRSDLRAQALSAHALALARKLDAVLEEATFDDERSPGEMSLATNIRAIIEEAAT